MLHIVQRVVRLYQLWNWLPHFRAIAETEHLPTASEALGLSPSALSRALKQLESAVGRPLFIRDRRQIRINEHGQMLLRAVRLAMRGVDDAITRLSGDESPLPLRITAPGPFLPLILDVVDEIATQFPYVRIEFSSCEPHEVAALLCRGIIDVCIHEEATNHEELTDQCLGEVVKVVACSPKHPLATDAPLSLAQVQPFAFAAPISTSNGLCPDGWPLGANRKTALSVSKMQMGIDACLSGRYLAVLPRGVARLNGLCELNIRDVELTSASLFVTNRQKQESQSTELTALIEKLTDAFSQ